MESKLKIIDNNIDVTLNDLEFKNQKKLIESYEKLREAYSLVKTMVFFARGSAVLSGGVMLYLLENDNFSSLLLPYILSGSICATGIVAGELGSKFMKKNKEERNFFEKNINSDSFSRVRKLR